MVTLVDLRLLHEAFPFPNFIFLEVPSYMGAIDYESYVKKVALYWQLF